jgi:hypothetical protein
VPEELASKKEKNKKNKKDHERKSVPKALESEEVPPTKLRKVDSGKKKSFLTFVPNPLAAASRAEHQIEPTEGKKKKSKGNETGLPIAKSKSFDFMALPQTKSKAQSSVQGTLDTEEAVWKNGPPPDIVSLFSSKPIDDSVEHGKALFDWLIHPMDTECFLKKYWEKKPFLAKRCDTFPSYFDWIMSTQKLDEIIRNNVLKYAENVDVVIYENGERVTISKDMQGN